MLFSLAFRTATGLITGAVCPYGYAVGYLLGILAGAYVSWALGGLAGLGLASLGPEFYRRTFLGVPEGRGAMLLHAWVSGSIRGAELGSLVSVILGVVVLRANWRRAGRWAKGLD